MKTKVDYVMYYRQMYSTGRIDIHEFGARLRDIRSYLNFIDMAIIEEMSDI